MLKSLFGLAEDVVKVVAAPVEIAVDAARIVTKPVADVAEEVVKEVKEVSKEITRD
jgi:hypothetical protein